ncbi:hypothetical protein L484_027611 [Morus notabilis]|uniref:Uncharacterized protein n=1 Tax=Morus notabilis TaxID=981085 RepID=W9RCA5_9ROSA|nr:hypothetical protein L484_027611 [Morus notabilis]
MTKKKELNLNSTEEQAKFTPLGAEHGTEYPSSDKENHILKRENGNDICGSSGNDNLIGSISGTSMIFQSDASIIGNAFSSGLVEDVQNNCSHGTALTALKMFLLLEIYG